MQNRDAHIDFIKMIAILCVITIHVTSNGWGIYAMGSYSWVSNMAWASLARAAVPLFFMCSGVLMLDPNKNLPLKKLYGKNLPRMAAAMFLWAMVYKIIHLLDEGRWSLASLWHAVKQVLIFNQEFHFYFLHIMILVYIALPVTRLITANADKRQMEYCLALWFVFGILYPTAIHFWPFTLLTGFPLQWMVNMTYASIGYGLLGYYIRFLASWGRKCYGALLAAGLAIVFGGTWAMCVARGAFSDIFLGGMSVGVALMAAGIFGCLPGKPSRFATAVSNASFCVYLVHVLFLYGFERAGLLTGLFPCIFSIPFLTACIFACSYAVYAVLARIPIVNKWLI